MSHKRTSATVTFPLVALAALLGCGSSAPSPELVDARKLYDQARQSKAAQLVPADLLTAQQALQGAESAHEEDAGSEKEKALAYIAQRKSAEAMALAGVQEAKRDQDALDDKYKGLQDRLRKLAEEQAAKNAAALKDNQQALDKVRDQLSDSGNKLNAASDELKKREAELAARQKQLEDQSKALEEQNKVLAVKETQLNAERAARIEAEKRAAAALASLQEIAKVKEEQRGLVITLEGAVLFASGKTTLLPIAKNKLDTVAKALKDQDPNKRIVVEGHTDSVGSDDANMRLSQSRADAVREYLVSQGVASDKISAVGKGETVPVADNKTPDGRANNRRVEIVIK